MTKKEVNMKTSVMYEKLKSVSKVLSLALMLLMLVTFGYAQSENLSDNQPSAPSSAPSTQKPILPTGSGVIQPALGSGAFTAYCTYRTWGAGPFYCWDSRINANSRVFAAVSEYSTDPQHRFLGAAIMTIHNIIPNNGYVTVDIDTGWTAFPINIRLDLFVDP
jgi:hypothetical protein